MWLKYNIFEKLFLKTLFLQIHLLAFNLVPLSASEELAQNYHYLFSGWRKCKGHCLKVKGAGESAACMFTAWWKGDVLDRPSELWPQGQTLSASDWQPLNHLAPVKDRHQECKPELITEKICHCHMLNESVLLLLVNDGRASKGIICYRD